MPSFFRTRRRLRDASAHASVGWWRRSRAHGLGQSATHSFHERFVNVSAKLLHPLLIPVVVSVDVHQPLERIASLAKVTGIEIHIEKFYEDFEILRLAVQLV